MVVKRFHNIFLQCQAKKSPQRTDIIGHCGRQQARCAASDQSLSNTHLPPLTVIITRER